MDLRAAAWCTRSHRKLVLNGRKRGPPKLASDRRSVRRRGPNSMGAASGSVVKFKHYLSRGVAQPGRAPGSGPGGRRFKSSLPDQYFQALKQHFWFSVYIDGVEIVDGHVFMDFPLGFIANYNPIFLQELVLIFQVEH
jgi:hypothetical protein